MRNPVIVVAVSQNGFIGKQQQLPWRLRSDLQRFKRLTMGHALLMGRKTFESIGRVLPGRTTVVITRQLDYVPEGVLVAHSLESALAMIGEHQIPFVVGGGEIYRLALGECRHLYLTRVLTDVQGDTRFDDWHLEGWECRTREHVPEGPHDQYASIFEEWVRV